MHSKYRTAHRGQRPAAAKCNATHYRALTALVQISFASWLASSLMSCFPAMMVTAAHPCFPSQRLSTVVVG